MSFVNNVSALLQNIIKTKTRERTLTRDKLHEWIENEMKGLNNFTIAYESLTNQDHDMLDRKIREFKVDSKLKTVIVYWNMKKRLHGNAITHEDKHAFFALYTAAKSLHTLLSEVLKNVDALFEHNNINIFNTKLSNALIYSILDKTKVFHRFIIFLFDGVLNEIGDATIGDKAEDKILIPPYRVKDLNDNIDKVAIFLNMILNHQGYGTIMPNIRVLKSNNRDINLVDAKGEFNEFAFQPEEIDPTTNEMMIEGIAVFNIVGFISDWFAILGHRAYIANTEERDWMVNRINLLRMQMAGTDPKSKEYKDLTNIVANYSDQASALEKKIVDYRNTSEN